jgi:hypothetical protein
MELENITLSKVSQVWKTQGHVFSHMWNINLKQMQLYYETLVTQWESHARMGRVG